MTAEPIDFAAVITEHTPWPRTTWCPVCTKSPGEPIRPPCEPYRLAKAASDLTGKVARVEAERDEAWDKGCAAEAAECGLLAGLAVALLCAFVVWYVRHNPPKE